MKKIYLVIKSYQFENTNNPVFSAHENEQEAKNIAAQLNRKPENYEWNITFYVQKITINF